MIETALTFDNPEDGSSLQVEIDTSGYSMTIFNGYDSTTMNLDRKALVRLINFLTDTLNEGYAE